MGKGEGKGGEAPPPARSSRQKPARSAPPPGDATSRPAPLDLASARGDSSSSSEERDAVASDRPAFDGPEPVLPCTALHALHHACVALACVAMFAHDGFFLLAPRHAALAAFMVWYADAYTAILHCALDREECLDYKILASAARGFQAHHEYPLASTRGRGLYRMLCDTHRIQVITVLSAAAFCRWNADAARTCLLKLLLAAYGGAAGHFFAHGGGARRGTVVRALQDLHLMLPPRHHVGGHHVKPHDKNFGIVNGLSNYALNPWLKDTRPRVKTLFAAWAFLSLFDVAIIERLVEPVERGVGGLWRVWGW